MNGVVFRFLRMTVLMLTLIGCAQNWQTTGRNVDPVDGCATRRAPYLRGPVSWLPSGRHQCCSGDYRIQWQCAAYETGRRRSTFGVSVNASMR